MPTYPAWQQPTGAHDAYDQGDIVAHNGDNWISMVNSNVWEPGVSGWQPYVEPDPEVPSLRERALEAYDNATNATEIAAREALAKVVGTEDAFALTLVDRQETESFKLLVFTDSDLYLAAREQVSNWEVVLVSDEGGWVQKSEALESLVDLGAVLAEGGA